MLHHETSRASKPKTLKIKEGLLNNKSPLRYPGGKPRACKMLDAILKEHFDIGGFTNIVSKILPHGQKATSCVHLGTG